VILFNEYQLKPLRSGQICVAQSEGGVLSAFRSLDVGSQDLYWKRIGIDELDSRAAIIGFRTFNQHVATGAWLPGCAVTASQLAQLVAHRTAIISCDHANASDKLLTRMAQQAIDDVIGATLGGSVTHALRELAHLGLDIGQSRDRQALQIVINLAERNGATEQLECLDIEQRARNGFVNAVTWLKIHATPPLLNDIADLAVQSQVARLLVTSPYADKPYIRSAHTQHLTSARDAWR
jgi:hypothetical protein